VPIGLVFQPFLQMSHITSSFINEVIKAIKLVLKAMNPFKRGTKHFVENKLTCHSSSTHVYFSKIASTSKIDTSCEAIGRRSGGGTCGAPALRMDPTLSSSFKVQTLFESLMNKSLPKKSFPTDDKCSIEGKLKFTPLSLKKEKGWSNKGPMR